VIVVLPREGVTPTKRTRVIAILMPNDQTVGFDWTKYRTTAREIQKKTGLKFFANLPPDLADALLDHHDEVEVRVSVPRRPGGKKGGAN
jgi:endonuclease G